ncbi:hypothetical protein ACF07Q_27820 [Nocardiopsis dassonvillei]|uniref:hypothetical protein n=1 Tax=Nocardiopsis dassonvillei TaxID=2014 RepID=UPI0036F662C8
MDLFRMLAGVSVSVLLPYSLPWVRVHLGRVVLVSLIFVTYAASPLLPNWNFLLVVAGSVGVAMALAWLSKNDSSTQSSPSLLGAGVGSILWPIGALVSVAALAVLVVDPRLFYSAIVDLLLDDKVFIVVSGFFLATFIGGELVTHLLRPFTDALDPGVGERMQSLKGAGAVIGWLERSLIFIFVIIGRPEGLAVVIAVKALARFPDLKEHQKGFAEYFMIGTLCSLGVSAFIGFAVRTIIT